MKDRIKDWLWLVTALAFGIYLSRWLMGITSYLLTTVVYG